jgi:hypothetical protein
MSKSPQIEQLNQSLQDQLKHRQVNVLVDQSADQLNVLLIKLPGASVSYPGLIEAIKSQITMCKIPNIARVKVLGLAQGQALPEWERIFPLFPIPAAPIVLDNDITVESSPLATSKSSSPKIHHRVSKRWSLGLGIGIAAVFALGHSLGTLNHNSLPDRLNHSLEKTLPQK